MKKNINVFVGFILLGILLFGGYSVLKYMQSRKALQEERLQGILAFSNQDISKCTLFSLEHLPSDEFAKADCAVGDPALFARQFSEVIDKHIKTLEPDVALALVFRYHITFESNDSVWYFEFDWNKEDNGVIDYRFANDRDIGGILTINKQGAQEILSMLEEAFNNRLTGII